MLQNIGNDVIINQWNDIDKNPIIPIDTNNHLIRIIEYTKQDEIGRPLQKLNEHSKSNKLSIHLHANQINQIEINKVRIQTKQPLNSIKTNKVQFEPTELSIQLNSFPFDLNVIKLKPTKWQFKPNNL